MRDNYLGYGRLSKNTRYADKTHYDNNGKRLCSTTVINPKFSDDKEKVTCVKCLKKLGAMK